MNTLDGLHRTTMYTETVDDNQNEENKALRKALQEALDSNEILRIRLRESEDENAKLKEIYKIQNTMSSMTFQNPPWGN